MNFPIGLQLYSVREDLEKDFEGTLRKVKALGYDAVEFAGLFGHGAEEVRNLCKEIGLIPLSAHVPFVDMMNDPDGVLKVYADIGCKFVVIPYLTEEYRPGQPKFQEVIDGAKLRKFPPIFWRPKWTPAGSRWPGKTPAPTCASTPAALTSCI